MLKCKLLESWLIILNAMLLESSAWLPLVLRTVLWIIPISYLLHVWIKRAPFVKAVNKLPGPWAIPFLGNIHQIELNPAEMFTKLMEASTKFGNVYRMWVLNEPYVILQRARDLEVILKDMTHHWKSIDYRFLYSWMGLGLLTSNEERWRVHRKVLTPAFHFNILHEFLPIFNKHALQMTKCLAAEPKSKHPSGFNIFQYSSLCSLDIICESSMGTLINAQMSKNSPYVTAVNRMNDLLVRRFFSPWLRPDFLFNLSPTKRELDRTLDYLNSFTDKVLRVIAERREYLKSKKLLTDKVNSEIGTRRSLAFLDLLIAAEEEGLEHMTQKDIRDQVSTFMFEGHDTVSTAMSWTLFMIGTYPEIQAKVLQELVDVFGDSGRAPNMSDLANLKYLERCIKETLRLYPSVAFMERECREDAQIENYTIPAGTTISVINYNLHRDPEFWPEPEKFDPDRFLPDNIKTRHPYAYIPFSAGPRNCIGQKYAVMEEKVVLSTILRRFRVEAAHTREEAVLQISIVLKPRNGLRIRLFDRDSHPKLRIEE